MRVLILFYVSLALCSCIDLGQGKLCTDLESKREQLEIREILVSWVDERIELLREKYRDGYRPSRDTFGVDLNNAGFFWNVIDFYPIQGRGIVLLGADREFTNVFFAQAYCCGLLVRVREGDEFEAPGYYNEDITPSKNFERLASFCSPRD